MLGGTNGVSSEHSPSRIEPHAGQVCENSVESPSSEHWRVLHEHEARSHFANDAGHFHPQSAALAVESIASAGDADVLTGKPARYHVNNAAPRPSVKGANVIPNRERRENAVILSLGKYARGVGLALDGADDSPSKQVAAENAATSACEKSQLIQGFSLCLAHSNRPRLKLPPFVGASFAQRKQNRIE
jgi:hypothetical protein